MRPAGAIVSTSAALTLAPPPRPLGTITREVIAQEDIDDEPLTTEELLQVQLMLAARGIYQGLILLFAHYKYVLSIFHFFH